jgi:hypothetical protein
VDLRRPAPQGQLICQQLTRSCTSSTPDQTEDYILTRFADNYGRAVSFAYAGPSDHDDLASVFVDADLLQQSMNHQLVAAGLVYPTYYSKLFPDLRNALTAAANQARTDQAGVWADGATTSGATITSLEALDDQLVILVGCQKPVSGHAARSYSWIRPPRRSRRWICLAAGGPAMAWCADRSGADRSRLRWGRWRL